MNNLDRLRLFLINYNISDEELVTILRDRGLNPYAEYDKYTDKKKMLSCVYASYSLIKSEIQRKQDLILNDILKELDVRA